MNARNNVTLIGRLVQENELLDVGEDTKVLRNRIAVDRSYKNKDGERETDFVNIVAWNGLAETIAQYTEKGNRVVVNGEIRTSRREANGNTYYNTDVRVNDISFVDFAEDNNDNTENNSSSSSDNNNSEKEEVVDEDVELDKELEGLELDVPF